MEKNNNMITEDGIATWVVKNGGMVLTRKIRQNLTNYFVKYVCLTGYRKIISLFVKKILIKLKQPITLILVESDIIKIPKIILNHPKIKKIFQWNKEIDNSKIKCIPIGLNKDRHYESLSKVTPLKEKTKLLMFNCSSNTHNSRKDVEKNNVILKISQKIDYIDPEKIYWRNSYVDKKIKISVTNEKVYHEMNKFKFIISPRGAGIDCHRTWEALYLGCIPVVLSSSINEIYEDLPVLVLKDWSELSEELLEKTWEDYRKKDWNFEKLNLDYWFNKFRE